MRTASIQPRTRDATNACENQSAGLRLVDLIAGTIGPILLTTLFRSE